MKPSGPGGTPTRRQRFLYLSTDEDDLVNIVLQHQGAITEGDHSEWVEVGSDFWTSFEKIFARLTEALPV